ncbi:MAG: pilus assembly protein [Lachnospiraceae bacterium]|nr:pilus assembly protein [Lachnospiraceae bacterium]
MKEQKGAATVEALLVMPIAFSFAMALIWMIRIFGIHSEVGAILNEVGASYVENSYVYAAIDGDTDDNGLALSEICEDIITEGDLIMRIKNEYAYTFMDDMFCGINIFGTPECVDIWADYLVTPPIRIPGYKGMRLHNRFYAKKFTGYTPAKTDEEEVYVTKGSKVYHTHLSCTALKTDIREVGYNSLKDLRNNDGSKYYACEKCGGKEQSGTVLITPYGNRFHTKRDCPELKLNVYKIPKSEIGGKRKCFYCE